MATAERGPNEALIGVPGSRDLLGTPALVLDLELMEANIASMAEYARNHQYQLRPVAKIHKSVEIARLQVAAGQRVLGFAKPVADTEGLGYAGVQAYVGDHQNMPDYDARRLRSHELLAPLVPLIERLKDAGLAPAIVSGGGTGTHDFDHEL